MEWFIKLIFCNLSERKIGFDWEICGDAIKTGIDGKFCRNKVSKRYKIHSVSVQESSDFEGKFFGRVVKTAFYFFWEMILLKNSSKTFNVLFKLRSKKLLILGKKARLMKVHFRVLKNNLRKTSSEKKDYELWYLYAQSSITCRMFGLEILKTCENSFLRWEEICLLWNRFTASCKIKFLQKLIEKVRTLCQKKIRNKINFFMSSGIVSLETYLKSYSKNSFFWTH